MLCLLKGTMTSLRRSDGTTSLKETISFGKRQIIWIPFLQFESNGIHPKLNVHCKTALLYAVSFSFSRKSIRTSLAELERLPHYYSHEDPAYLHCRSLLGSRAWNSSLVLVFSAWNHENHEFVLLFHIHARTFYGFVNCHSHG